MRQPCIRDSSDGALLKVRVAPGASRERIVGVHGDALKVAVREAPERGRANGGVERLLAEGLGARPRDVEVARGATSRNKEVRFHGWTRAHLADRMRALLLTLDNA